MSLLVAELGPDIGNTNLQHLADAARGEGKWDRTSSYEGPSFRALCLERWQTPEDSKPHSAVWVRDHQVVVFDGRIDDRARLIRDLHAPPDATSAELAGRAFERWGHAAAKQLIGEFAFLIFDRDQLTLVRDRLGIRPLYALQLGSRWRIASAEPCLFADGALKESPSPRMLARAIAGVAVTSSETLREHVRVVPAASITMLPSWTESRYYEPDPGGVLDLPEREHIDRIRGALDLAIADRIRGPYPIAAQQSGGLDSSTTVALASLQLVQAARPAPVLLHMRASGLPCDERSYARAMAAQYGATLLEAEGARPFRPSSVTHYVELGGPWCEPYAELYRGARDARVVLTGEGSDELQLRHGSEVDDAVLRRSWIEAARFAGVVEDPTSLQGWKVLGRALLRERLSPQRLRGRAVARASKRLPSYLTSRARDDAMEAQIQWLDRLDAPKHESPLRRAVCAELTSTPGMTLILHELQQFASAMGVELSHPFLDARVVDAFAALPAHLRLAADIVKPTHRKMMEGLLPPGILWRYPPTDYTSLHESAHRLAGAEWRHLLLSPRLADVGVVDGAKFAQAGREMLDALDRRECGVLTLDLAYAFAAEAWLNRHF